MKKTSAFLLCVLLSPALFAQAPATSGSANANPFFAHESTTDDLRKAITRHHYAYERGDSPATASVAFSADGTGVETYPDDSGNPIHVDFTWHARNPREIVIRISYLSGAINLKFSADYSTYAGTDLDGMSPLKGWQLLPGVDPHEPPDSLAAPVPTAIPAASASPASALNALSENTGDDLRKAIVTHPYTWEPGNGWPVYISFKANGTGSQTAHYNISWRVKNPQEVEVNWPDNPTHIKAVLKFNADYSAFTGTDFDGKTPISGRQVAANPQ